MMRQPRFGRMLKRTVHAYSEDNIATLSAALSYYAIFSLAPLLLVVIAVAGWLFGESATRGQLFAQLHDTVGPQAAGAIQAMLAGVQRSGHGLIASVIGLATLLLGASGVFAQLQTSLNLIWRTAPSKEAGWRTTLRRRALTFAVLLAIAAVTLASLVAEAALGTVGRYFADRLPGGETMWHLAQFGTSLAMMTLLFAVVFKILPDAVVGWRDTVAGAVFTSLFFTLGKLGLGIYLGKSGISSAYGAAGSLVLLLVWIYYSAQIFFIGAEFTRAYAQNSNAGARPAPRLAAVAKSNRVPDTRPGRRQA